CHSGCAYRIEQLDIPVPVSKRGSFIRLSAGFFRPFCNGGQQGHTSAYSRSCNGCNCRFAEARGSLCQQRLRSSVTAPAAAIPALAGSVPSFVRENWKKSFPVPSLIPPTTGWS